MVTTETPSSFAMSFTRIVIGLDVIELLFPLQEIWTANACRFQPQPMGGCGWSLQALKGRDRDKPAFVPHRDRPDLVCRIDKVNEKYHARHCINLLITMYFVKNVTKQRVYSYRFCCR
jgi:hypothetical protein